MYYGVNTLREYAKRVIITVAGFKGGQGKSTTAAHLAAYFARKAPTLLVDGDPNRSASRWAEAGELPFRIVGESQAVRLARDYEHIIIDTKARPETQDLKELAAGCHLLVLPCTPDTLSLDALRLTVHTLQTFGAASYRVLLTIVPPAPNRDGERAREALTEAGFPLFRAQIPRLVAFQRSIAEGRTVESAEYEAVGREIEELRLG